MPSHQPSNSQAVSALAQMPASRVATPTASGPSPAVASAANMAQPSNRSFGSNPQLTPMSTAEMRAPTASPSSQVNQLSEHLQSLTTAVVQGHNAVLHTVQSTIATQQQKSNRKTFVKDHVRAPLKERIMANFTKLNSAGFIQLVNEVFTEAQMQEQLATSADRFVRTNLKKFRRCQRAIYGEANRRMKMTVANWANDNVLEQGLTSYRQLRPNSEDMRAVVQAASTETVLKALARKVYLDDDPEAQVTDRQWHHLGYAMNCWAHGRPIKQPTARVHVYMPVPAPNPDETPIDLQELSNVFLQTATTASA